MKRTQLVATLATIALAGGTLAGGTTANAEAPAKKPKVSTLAKGLVSPLSLAVAENGTVYYSENFKGTLLGKKPGKKPRVIYQDEQGAEVGAVSERVGNLRFALTTSPAEEGGEPGAFLMGVGNSGKAVRLADLYQYEKTKNPDAGVTYGFRSLPEGCEVPEDFAGYPGIVESHPYATAQSRSATFVADAAGNTILKYSRKGRLSTLAVLPAVPVKATAQMAEAFGIPECAIGSTYYFEPVPTDVELGRDGHLYVTTLPGGPEDGSLGALASVYRINQSTGGIKRVASGLLSATGLAMDARGRLFVAEMFRGRIAVIKPGGGAPRTFRRAVLPGDLEIGPRGDLYATQKVLVGPSEEEPDTPPGGEVVRIRR